MKRNIHSLRSNIEDIKKDEKKDETTDPAQLTLAQRLHKETVLAKRMRRQQRDNAEHKILTLIEQRLDQKGTLISNMHALADSGTNWVRDAISISDEEIKRANVAVIANILRQKYDMEFQLGMSGEPNTLKFVITWKEEDEATYKYLDE